MTCLPPRDIATSPHQDSAGTAHQDSAGTAHQDRPAMGTAPTGTPPLVPPPRSRRRTAPPPSLPPPPSAPIITPPLAQPPRLRCHTAPPPSHLLPPSAVIQTLERPRARWRESSLTQMRCSRQHARRPATARRRLEPLLLRSTHLRRYVCTYVKIRRHQHTRVHARTGPRVNPVRACTHTRVHARTGPRRHTRAPACHRHHIPRLVRRHSTQTTIRLLRS